MIVVHSICVKVKNGKTRECIGYSVVLNNLIVVVNYLLYSLICPILFLYFLGWGPIRIIENENRISAFEKIATLNR